MTLVYVKWTGAGKDNVGITRAFYDTRYKAQNGARGLGNRVDDACLVFVQNPSPAVLCGSQACA